MVIAQNKKNAASYYALCIKHCRPSFTHQQEIQSLLPLCCAIDIVYCSGSAHSYNNEFISLTGQNGFITLPNVKVYKIH